MGAVKILIVDDDRALRDALRRALVLGGYDTVPADSGEAALAEVTSGAPDAVVLDIGLPDIDGLEVCRRLRGAGNRVPVLMLTARDAVSDRIDGLDAGADDYLVKPFDVGELRARLRALLRRSRPDGDADGQSFHELHLDGARHGVSVGDSFVELTRTEYQLLELLMLNSGRVLPHNLIYERVWGYDSGPASNALWVYIGYLRRKLEQAGARPLLHTVRGVGYVLREP
jgi:two-component system, OmpR family, response regulator MprA